MPGWFPEVISRLPKLRSIVNSHRRHILPKVLEAVGATKQSREIRRFKDPNVFVMLALANILGIVMLLILARFLSRDNKVKLEAL